MQIQQCPRVTADTIRFLTPAAADGAEGKRPPMLPRLLSFTLSECGAKESDLTPVRAPLACFHPLRSDLNARFPCRTFSRSL